MGRPYRWKTPTGEAQAGVRRWRAVASTRWAKTTAARRVVAQPAERGRLDSRQAQGQRRPWAWEADAHAAAAWCRRELRVEPPPLTAIGSADWVPTKRTTRGRPPTGAPRPRRQRWRVSWHVQEATEALRARAQRASRGVLATHVRAPQDRPDGELLRADKGQPVAELRLKWAKHPAASAPIVPETPTRRAALGWVYRSARLVYAVVERPVRQALRARGATLPDRPAPSQRPTARTVVRLMRHLAVVTLAWSGRSHRPVTTLHPHQLHVIKLLGYEAALDALPHRHSG